MFDFFKESSGYNIVFWQFIVFCFSSVVLVQLVGACIINILFKKHDTAFDGGTLIKFFFEQAMGIAFLMLSSLCLAFFGIFNIYCVLILLLIYLFFFRKFLYFYIFSYFRSYSFSEFANFIIIVIAGISVFFDVWRLPGHWDDVSYHLALAKNFLEHGDLSPNEWLRFPYFPAFGQLFFALGLMVDASLAQWLANWPTVLVLAGAMGLSQHLLKSSVWGVIAWGIYVKLDFVEAISGYAYLDMILAFYVTAMAIAIVMFINAREEKEGRAWVLVAAIMAGVSAGLKLHGLVLAFFAGISVLIFSGSLSRALKNGLTFGIVSIFIFSFWYIRSYYFTGDPVHPSGGSIFGYYLWNEADLKGQLSEQATHGVVKEWGNFFIAFQKLKLQYLVIVLIAPLMAISQNKKWMSLWFLSISGIMFWFWVSQVERYLMPILPIALIICFLPLITLWKIASQKIHFQITEKFSILLLIIPLLIIFHQLREDFYEFIDRPSIVQQKKSKDEIFILNKAKEFSKIYGGKIINTGYENAFFYSDLKFMGDWFGPAGFSKTLECGKEVCEISASKMKELMKELDVGMLLVNEGRWRIKSDDLSKDYDILYRHGQGILLGIK